MPTRQFASSTKLKNLLRTLAPSIILAGGLVVILYTTLENFDFAFRPLSTADYFGGFILFPQTAVDFPRNILLFMPFGFGLSSILAGRGQSSKSIVLITLFTGFLLTFSVESLQFFLPDRGPAISDIVANTLGALAGWLCFELWTRRPAFPVTRQRQIAAQRSLVVFVVIYLVVLLFIGYQLGQSTRLTNWDISYPLLFGNEASGDRPWSGSLEEITIWAEALPAGDIENLLSRADVSAVARESIAAHYSLAAPYTLTDKEGCLPDLTWIGGWIAPNENGINRLDQNQWLITEDSAHCLSERLLRSSRFTIYLALQAADQYQSGPARIMSISANTARRNLMLGQQGQDLIVRIRTPLTGENGAVPEIRFPDVFANPGKQLIIVSYDGSRVRLATADDLHGQTFLIHPGVSFLRTFIQTKNHTTTMDPASSRLTAISVALLLLLPVGILLGLWWKIARERSS